MRLYWVDAFFDKIEHSNFDGQNRISLDRITQISQPFGLTIFEGNTSLKTLYLNDRIICSVVIDKVMEIFFLFPFLQATRITQTGVWEASYVCARRMAGKWLLSEEESATSCMSSLSAPPLKLVSSFIHCSSHSTIHA